MKDRISNYPGRVRLEPVPGQENTYDLVRADEPTQEGTPLNKATLLKDSTAAALGLSDDALPDDALNELKALVDKSQTAANLAQSRADDTFTKAQTLTAATASLYGLGSSAVPNDVLSKIRSLITTAQSTADQKARIATGSYTGTGTYGASNPCSLTFPFVPKLVFIQSNNSSARDFGYLFAVRGMSYAHGWVVMSNYSILPQTITWLSNGMRWYMSSASDGRYQLNGSGESYYYAALG